MNRTAAILACSFAALTLGFARQTAESTGYPCVSRPSDVRELGFSIRGKVGEVAITPGQAVTKGQPLVRLEDSVQRAIVAYTKLQAEDDSNIKLAQSDVDYRTKEHALIQQALGSNAGNDAQLREARYRLEQSTISLEAAMTQRQVRTTELARERAQLEQMVILAPIAGSILDVRKHPGETADEGTPVLTVVSIDPLWLDASVPIRDSANIAVGQPASVVFEDWDSKPMAGKVIYKAAAGNAGARQVQIRIEIPNPAQIPSGMHGHLTLAPH